jgi:PAS domain S-box-containing protein
MENPRLRVAWAILLGGLLPPTLTLAARTISVTPPLMDVPVHAYIQLAGSCIALVAASLVLLRARQEPSLPHLRPLTMALAGMGLMDAAQAFATPGAAWYWLHSGAALAGGMLLVLVWLPRQIQARQRKRVLIPLIAFLAFTASLTLSWRPEGFSAPFDITAFGMAPMVANMLGCAAFFSVAVFFFRRYLRHAAAEDLALASFALLSSTSAWLFPDSHLWATDWWMLHGFRLLAYAIVLITAYQTLFALYERDSLHRLELENQVEARTSELQRMAEIVESTDDSIVSCSVDGTICTWNRGATRLYGYSSAEAIGQPATLLAPPDLKAEMEAIFHGPGLVNRYETVRMRKDGQRIDVAVTLSPIRNAQGSTTGVCAISRDITQRKWLDQHRKRVEAELEEFFSVSPDMLCIAGFDGYFKRLNPAWETALGWPLEHLLGKPWIDLVHPDDQDGSREVTRLRGSSPGVVAFENRLRAQDGRYHWLRWNSRPDPDRQLMYAAARDITEEKASREELARVREQLENRVRERTAELESAVQALNESEELFRKLFEDSPIGTVLVDLNRKIQRQNRAFCELLGYSAAELGFLLLDRITHADDAPATLRFHSQLSSGLAPACQFTTRYLHKSGAIVWAECTATLIRDDRGSPLSVLCMAEDTTKRMLREQEISPLNGELKDRIHELMVVNKELESFNYTVAHDLRAPLRHIDGYSKILMEEHGKTVSQDALRCMGKIRDGARKMGRMVDELLELSRTSRCEVSKQSTGLRSLVLDVIEEMAPETRNRHIDWRIGDLPFLDCDPTLTRQVLANLLSNAVKFTRTRNPAVIELGHFRQEGQTVVFVRDNGVGFIMKYSDKLFGLFQRLHRREEFEGTGVGLVTVQRIAQKHGGRAWAEAEPEKGATFYFTLGAAGGHRNGSATAVQQSYQEKVDA